MRVGVVIIPTDPWPVAVEQARRVEALGFDHLWTYDHLSWRRYRDEAWFGAIPWLTGIAAATDSIQVGTMVATPNFRHPVPFAKEVMTLDHVSGGRTILGLGAGGRGFDATVLGGDALPRRRATGRFVEFVELLDRLLASRRPPPRASGSQPTKRAWRPAACSGPGCRAGSPPPARAAST